MRKEEKKREKEVKEKNKSGKRVSIMPERNRN